MGVESKPFPGRSDAGGLTLAYYAVVYEHGVIDHTTHALSEPGIDAAATVFRNAIFAEYVPFIVLLFSLYVIAGGISLRGDLEARPSINTAFMATGAGLASLIGTTGAAMLLIRPLLNTNSERRHVTHTVVFFIFLVCNTGGCLLPIGVPPLFLGYLRGVPFFWTLNLWPAWLAVNVFLLGVYYCWDWLTYRREERRDLQRDRTQIQPLRMTGRINFLWIGGVIAAVILLDPSKQVPLLGVSAPPFCREVVMLALAALSLVTTPTGLREENKFSYVAIIEVAALFLGIFICMQVPVQILTARGEELGIDTPVKFFWSTGILSSFLDNAPTYVVFFETAKSLFCKRCRDRPRSRRGVLPPRRHQPGVRLLRGLHLHRQRPELHGQVDRRAKRGEDAELLRLHVVQRSDSDSDVCARDLPFSMIAPAC